MSEMLVSVDAPYFNAAIILKDGRCVKAAPILYRHAFGKSESYLRAYFKRKGWTAIIVRPLNKNGEYDAFV